MSDALKLRKQRKDKKPEFNRTDSNKYNFKAKWRKPRGLHNKLRLHHKGHTNLPSIGYRSPVKVRGLDRSGLNPVIVASFNELNLLDVKKDGILIASTVGAKKKVKLLEKIKEKGLTLLNVKDVDAYIKSVEENLNSRKKISAEIKKKKEEATKKAEAETKSKEDSKDKVSKEVKDQPKKDVSKETEVKVKETPTKEVTSKKEDLKKEVKE